MSSTNKLTSWIRSPGKSCALPLPLAYVEGSWILQGFFSDFIETNRDIIWPLVSVPVCWAESRLNAGRGDQCRRALTCCWRSALRAGTSYVDRLVELKRIYFQQAWMYETDPTIIIKWFLFLIFIFSLNTAFWQQLLRDPSYVLSFMVFWFFESNLIKHLISSSIIRSILHLHFKWCFQISMYILMG